MACELLKHGFVTRALKSLFTDSARNPDPDRDIMTSVAKDVVNALSFVGDNHYNEYVDGFNRTGNDLDTLVMKMSGYDKESGAGYASFNDVMKQSEAVRAAFLRQMQLTITEIVEKNPDPDVYGGLDSIIKSSIGLQAFHAAVKGMKYDKPTAEQTLLTRELNNKIALWDNPIVAFKHFEPGRKALALLHELHTFSDTGMKVFTNQISDLLDKASTKTIFKENRISRAMISRMLTAMDGLNTDTPAGEAELAGRLMSMYNVDESISDDVVLALSDIRRDWNIINYGKAVIEDGDISKLSENPLPNSIVAFYKALNTKVREYFNETVKVIGKNAYTDEIERALNSTTLLIRRDYMPTIDHDMFGLSLEELGNSLPKYVTPGMYRSKSFFNNNDNNIDFELLMGNNLRGNYSLFNKLMKSVARARLDYEVRKETLLNNNTNEYTGHALKAAELLIKKLDAEIDYNSSNQTAAAKFIKNKIGSLGSVMVAGILGGPASSVVNIGAGRVNTIAAGINVGSSADLDKIRKSGTVGERILLSLAEEHSANYLSPGMASNYESISNDMMSKIDTGIRKFADWLGDGSFFSGWSAWKKYMTVKGSEENYLRKYFTNMVFLELNERMLMSNIDEGTKQYEEAARKLVPEISIAAWNDLSGALGHFDPLNKPIWAHVALETAETGPQAAVALFGHYWYMFRHVMVTSVDNMIRGARASYTPGYSRWDYLNVKGVAEGFHTKGALHNPKIASTGLLALALFSLVRDFLKSDEPEGSLATSLDLIARGHMRLIDSSNPIQGLDDFAKYLAFMSGVAHVDDETYRRYKRGAIQFAAGMAGGRPIAQMFENDKGLIDSMANLVSFKADWMKIFTDDVIDAGVYGKGIRDLKKEYREDTQLLRSIWAVDLLSTIFVEGMMLGGVKPTTDKRAAVSEGVNSITAFIARQTALRPWFERFEGSEELRQKYVKNSALNKLLNKIKYDEHESAYKYMPKQYRMSRMAYLNYRRDWANPLFTPSLRTQKSFNTKR